MAKKRMAQARAEIPKEILDFLETDIDGEPLPALFPLRVWHCICNDPWDLRPPITTVDGLEDFVFESETLRRPHVGIRTVARLEQLCCMRLLGA